MTVSVGFAVTVSLLKPLSLGAGEPFPHLSQKLMGTGEWGLQHSVILYWSSSLAVCQRQTLVKLLLQPRVSYLLSVRDTCGSHDLKSVPKADQCPVLQGWAVVTSI